TARVIRTQLRQRRHAARRPDLDDSDRGQPQPETRDHAAPPPDAEALRAGCVSGHRNDRAGMRGAAEALDLLPSGAALELGQPNAERGCRRTSKVLIELQDPAPEEIDRIIAHVRRRTLERHTDIDAPILVSAREAELQARRQPSREEARSPGPRIGVDQNVVAHASHAQEREQMPEWMANAAKWELVDAAHRRELPEYLVCGRTGRQDLYLRQRQSGLDRLQERRHQHGVAEAGVRATDEDCGARVPQSR